MNHTPENSDEHREQRLERLIDKALRDQPLQRAPADFQARVLAQIARRAAAPWWQGSFTGWPMAARLLFLLVSAGFAKLLLEATNVIVAPLDPASRGAALFADFAWISAVFASFGAMLRGLPSIWLYGGLTVLAMLYLTLFGVSAAAYRTLYAPR